MVISSFKSTKKFPAINYKTIGGKTITNEIFKEKKTLAVLAHLGCPPAMMLLKDLEGLSNPGFQILVFLENSRQQILDFNAEEVNTWSIVRNHFRLQPLTGSIIAECETTRNKEKSGSDIMIGSECRKLSKKLKTKDSPTLVLVKENGEISHILNGYFGDKERETRLEKLLKLQ